MTTETVAGQDSWVFGSSTVRASVTRLGGMLGPVTFRLGDREVQPFSVAPWHSEPDAATEPVLRALRGDFFCMPFGSTSDPFLGVSHPLHGESANDEWTFDACHQSTLDIVLEYKSRPCKVYKTIRCGDGSVYQRHTVIGLVGAMNFGQHAMLACPNRALLSFSKMLAGQVFPGQFEDPARGGYSSLRPGAEFDDLSAVPLATGGTTDLREFPAREGYDDLVQIVSDPSDRWAWSAASFPEERCVYVQIKDARVLTGTVLWFSHGGRHYAPWSGRHRGVVALEEVTSYFHLGTRGSVAPNPFQARGVATYRDFVASEPLEVKTVLLVAEAPQGFGRVAAVVRAGAGVVIVDEEGNRIERPLDVHFLGIP